MTAMASTRPVTDRISNRSTTAAAFGNVSEDGADTVGSTTSAFPVAPATTVRTTVGRSSQITWHRPDNQGGTP